MILARNRAAHSVLALGLIALALHGATGRPTAQPATPNLAWDKQLLTWSDPSFPGGSLQIWYPEAFCRTGAHGQTWDKTTWPHRTELLATNAAGTEIQFLTVVRETVELRHTARLLPDGLEFDFEFTNRGPDIDLQWFQPACVRVAGFTGADQQTFVDRSFIFTADGLAWLGGPGRTTRALYLGGQVFIPEFTQPGDANPRPIASARPVHG